MATYEIKCRKRQGTSHKAEVHRSTPAIFPSQCPVWRQRILFYFDSHNKACSAELIYVACKKLLFHPLQYQVSVVYQRQHLSYKIDMCAGCSLKYYYVVQAHKWKHPVDFKLLEVHTSLERLRGDFSPIGMHVY